jgi:DNA replication protein DnaC
MNDGILETVGSLLPSFKGLHMVAGSCEVHGAADVLVRDGSEWHCPRCLEAAMAEETQAIWLADRTKWLMDSAMIPAKYVGQKFVASTPEQMLARNTVRTFRDFILREPTWAALLMIGKTGTGKTLLACQFAQSLIANASKSVRYITAKGMISEIQATYGREGKSEEGEILRFAQYDVLILDEIDAIPARENSSLLLTEIINRRYNDNKPVVAISNQPFDDLSKFVGDRVYSRLHENVFQAAFTWADARKAP